MRLSAFITARVLPNESWNKKCSPDTVSCSISVIGPVSTRRNVSVESRATKCCRPEGASLESGKGLNTERHLTLGSRKVSDTTTFFDFQVPNATTLKPAVGLPDPVAEGLDTSVTLRICTDRPWEHAKRRELPLLVRAHAMQEKGASGPVLWSPGKCGVPVVLDKSSSCESGSPLLKRLARSAPNP
jgi:hypothetical protein